MFTDILVIVVIFHIGEAAVVVPTGGCGGILKGPDGAFSSPGFPQNYPNYVSCFWQIEVPQNFTLKILFTDFKTEECCDAVSITAPGAYAGYYMGNLGLFYVPLVTPSLYDMVVDVWFAADGSGTDTGFQAYYSINSPYTHCGGVLQGLSGSFSSPGFPQNYPNFADCKWEIKVPFSYTLKIDFMDFNTEECDDFVYIRNSGTIPFGPLKGNLGNFSVPAVTASVFERDEMTTVHFWSNEKGSESGFQAHYIITDTP